MSRYHINPELGPMPCSADDGQCPYGVEAPHFDNKEDANSHFLKELENNNDAFSSLKKNNSSKFKVKKSKIFSAEVRALNSKLEDMSYDNLISFANSSKENHANLGEVIKDRSKIAVVYKGTMSAINPHDSENKKAVSRASFDELQKDLDSYQAQTAEFLMTYAQSSHNQNKPIFA